MWAFFAIEKIHKYVKCNYACQLYRLLPKVSKGFCKYYLERYLEDNKPSSEKGNPANFDIDEVGGDNDMQGTGYKVRQKYKCLQRDKNPQNENTDNWLTRSKRWTSLDARLTM